MKIGLVPISAKPYHLGHHTLVKYAAEENDQVILFVSLSDRKRKGEFPILGSDMERIWKDHIEKILPNNVRVEYGGSPVRKVYETLGSAEIEKSSDVYMIYSDPEDSALNYPKSVCSKYFPELLMNNQVICAAEGRPEKFSRGIGTPDISGTKLRAMLAAGDRKEFAKGMPEGLNADAVFDILTGSSLKNEYLLKKLVKLLI